MFNLRALLFSILLAFAAYAAWVLITGYEEVAQATVAVGWSGILIASGLSLINYFLRFLRWHWMVKRLGHSIPSARHLIYYLSGFALTTTPGKAGEAVRGLYLKKYDVPYKNTIAAVFVERIFDLVSVTLIAILALYYFEDYRIFGWLTAALVLTLLMLIQYRPFLELLRKLGEVGPAVLGKLVNHSVDILERALDLLGVRFFSFASLFGVIAWGSEAVAFALIVHWMGGDFSWLILFGIYALSMLVGALSFLPGGLGSAEAVMALLLVALGMSAGEAASATIICRFTTLWLAVLIGGGCMGYLETRNARNVVQST